MSKIKLWALAAALFCCSVELAQADDSAIGKSAFREQLSERDRVAGLSLFWSQARFYFANFDLVPRLDWDSAYLAALGPVSRAGSTLAYYKEMMRFAALLRDGHTNVYPPEQLIDREFTRPAVRTRKVEGKVVVVSAPGVAPGTEIVAVNGTSVEAYARREVAPFVSASSPQDRDVRIYDYSLLSGPLARPVVLTLRQSSRKVQRSFPRLRWAERSKLFPKLPYVWRPGRIGYFALNEFSDDRAARGFEEHFSEIRQSSALILDLRENGGGSDEYGFRVLNCLVDRPYQGTRWRTPAFRAAEVAWGRSVAPYEEAGETQQPSSERHFSGPVIMLIGPRTFSAGEDCAVAFDASGRGRIFGEPSGGSTGQPIFFSLPGGGQARICSKRDFYPDGKEFIGRGVQPQVVVPLTLADVRSGRDSALDAATRALDDALSGESGGGR